MDEKVRQLTTTFDAGSKMLRIPSLGDSAPAEKAGIQGSDFRRQKGVHEEEEILQLGTNEFLK